MLLQNYFIKTILKIRKYKNILSFALKAHVTIARTVRMNSELFPYYYIFLFLLQAKVCQNLLNSAYTKIADRMTSIKKSLERRTFRTSRLVFFKTLRLQMTSRIHLRSG